MQAGQIPILRVEADTIPLAYEQAIKEVWERGISIRTEYDRPEDPPSRDATVIIVVREPFAQPRFHRSFADGLGGLAEYVMEVVHGAHDYWVKPLEEILKGTESKDTRWTYTYHGRLFEYRAEAITTLMRKIAERIGEKISRPVRVGRYADISDSLHIYGSYFREIEGDPEKGIKSFFAKLESRSFEERTWHSDFVKPYFIDDGLGKGLKPMLARETEMPADVRQAIDSELRSMEKVGYIV